MAEKVVISGLVDSKHCDYKFEVVLIGDTPVGKTSLMRRFVDDEFRSHGTLWIPSLLGFLRSSSPSPRDTSDSPSSPRFETTLIPPFGHLAIWFILIGDYDVGKTSLMERFVDDEFRLDTAGTNIVNFVIRKLYIGQDVIQVQIWDTAGQERYRSIIEWHISGKHGVLLVYSITSRKTFDSLQYWLVHVKKYADPNVVIMLVGNECDCESSREVTTQEGLDFANRNAMSFYETSAKESINVGTVFTKLFTEIYNKRDVLKIPCRNKPSLTIAPGSDPTALFKTLYKEVLKKHGAVSVEVLRALFVGPSGAGKSSLRHLLVHGKSKEMSISTPVMETPDILVFGEHYTVVEGSSVWKPVSESCLIQSVKVCATKKNYQKCEQYPTSIGNSLSGYPERGIFERMADWVLQYVRIPQRRLQSEGSKCLEASRSEVMDSVVPTESSIPLDKASFLHVIDSGGQPAFQDILPLLLAIPCTYIQVFDASKDLDEPIRSTYRPQKGVELPLSSNQPLETQWEFIQYSLSSMQTMAHKFACKDLEIFKSTCPEPRIIIAGTFKDKVLASGKSEEIVSNVEQRIKSLEGKPYFRHIQWPDSSGFFLVDNHMTIHSKGKGEGVDLAYLNKLRECISDKSGILKVDVPLMWFQLELVTRRIEKKFFAKDELKRFCLKNGYIDQRKADEQFLCLLKLLHVLGFYAYFDLDPQYLRGSVNHVCTDATALYKEVSKLLAVQFTPAQSGATKQFQSTGIIPHPYESLLSELGVITDVDPVWFLEVLHHVGIAARLTPSRDPPSYFIPSCLPYGKAKVPAYSSVGPLCITFVFEQDSFTTHCDLPRSVFCRLVVELADRKWKVILQESDRKSVKFSCPRPSTYVYLTEKPGHIQCQIVIDESAALSSLPDLLQEIHHHCSAIRARLEENLHHITQQVFGEEFHEIAQIRPVLPCSCQPDVPYTAPVNDGVATCFHCGSFPKLSPSHKVWFSPPDPSEAMVRVVRETGVAFWKLEEVSAVDEPLPTYYPIHIPPSTKIRSSCVDEGLKASQLNLTKTDMSDSTDGTTSPLDGASQTDLNDKCPSDVGVLGILKHIPQWYDLAVKLGVPIAQVEAYKSNPTTGGNQALSYWRNGLCGQQFPTTWGFLLETVDNLHGPRVAEKLRDEAERDKTWSQS